MQVPKMEELVKDVVNDKIQKDAFSSRAEMICIVIS
jgi:hypothetical protein